MSKTQPETSADRVTQALQTAPNTIFSRLRTPAEEFHALAEACEQYGLDQWDLYGDGGPIAILETEVRELLAVEAAVFFPSGIMAQQVALRIHTDRARNPRVALPDLSHLLVHEEDGPRILHGLQYEYLTRGNRVATRANLDAIPGELGAVLVELPLRDAGCLLPTWEELVDLGAACHERGVALHIDGARLWESTPHLEHSLAEIVALADTAYLSFYKGLGALAGAVLVGDQATVAEARVWRRRLGGTTYHATAIAASALVGLRSKLAGIPQAVQWARQFTAALPSEITSQPAPVHTNQFHLYTLGNAEWLNRFLHQVIEESGVGFCRPWRATQVPGVAATEIAVAVGEPAVTPEEAAALMKRVIDLALAEDGDSR